MLTILSSLSCKFAEIGLWLKIHYLILNCSMADDVNGSKFPMIISSGKFQRRVIYMKY